MSERFQYLLVCAQCGVSFVGASDFIDSYNIFTPYPESSGYPDGIKCGQLAFGILVDIYGYEPVIVIFGILGLAGHATEYGLAHLLVSIQYHHRSSKSFPMRCRGAYSSISAAQGKLGAIVATSHHRWCSLEFNDGRPLQDFPNLLAPPDSLFCWKCRLPSELVLMRYLESWLCVS